jgi:dolichol-phosphate mannosyltransferase
VFEQKGPTLNPQGFKILLEFVGRDRDLRVDEIGYSFRRRTYGETKLSPSVIRSYLLAVFELRAGRQIKGQFFLYALVGAFGLVVNVIGFGIGEALGLGSVRTGISSWIDPVDLSVALGIELNILSNFLLNNYFTFWERRVRGRWLIGGFLMFQVVSVIGGIIQFSVFRFFDSTGFGWDAVGREPARYLHNGAGMLIALVSNYFLNVNYTWGRRRPVE